MMGQKPRLLFVGSFADDGREPGGVNTQCRLMVQALESRVDFRLLDSTLPYLPPPGVFVRLPLAARRIGRIIVLLIRERFDAVLIFSSSGLSFVEKGLMALFARAAGVPVVWSVRSGAFRTEVENSRLFAVIARALLGRANRILCQGESWASFYESQMRVPRKRLFVIPNWIALDQYGPNSQPRASGPTRLLFVGWIKRAKGVFELVDALVSSPALAGVEADFVGFGEDSQKLQESVERHGATDRLRLHGWRVGNELRQFFTNADVLVLPSHAEGLPNVVLEAMASGLPVIVTPVGAVPDVVKDHVNGLIVPVGDVRALQTAIETLAIDEDLRRRMGEQNRQSARDYSVDQAADRLLRELSVVASRFAQDPGHSVVSAVEGAPES